MALQQFIQNQLKEAMKARESDRLAALRVLVGEFQRQEKKELDDASVVSIIRKLVKSEKETMEKSGRKTSAYLEVLEGYLPKAPTEEEIEAWVRENIDFSSFAGKMQAMKPIMAHFQGLADGRVVRSVLERI